MVNDMYETSNILCQEDSGRQTNLVSLRKTRTRQKTSPNFVKFRYLFINNFNPASIISSEVAVLSSKLLRFLEKRFRFQTSSGCLPFLKKTNN